MQNRPASAGLLGLRERPVHAHGSNHSRSLHNATFLKTLTPMILPT
jgi:hypothetical protein